MSMPKSRDIQAKIPLPKAIWNEFWLVTVNEVNSNKKGIVSSELRELLEYIDSSRIPEGSSNPLIKELDDALVKARSNEEWRHDFMTLELLKRECREEG